MGETISELAQYQTDHDILIEVRTEMRLLRETVKSSFESGTKQLDDHETRIRSLERSVERTNSQYFNRQSLSGGGLATIAATIIVAILHALHVF
jgi:uncharacterized membrane protein